MNFNFSIDSSQINRERNPLNSLWSNNLNVNKMINPINTNLKGMKYNYNYNNCFYNKNNYMKGVYHLLSLRETQKKLIN